MEIKRELVLGELAELRRAVLPAIAAAGGMMVPAGIYLLWAHGSQTSRGWGVPVATDIAFALGCLALLRGRVPNSLVVFLTALAIFDDLGAILVIALFYGGQLHGGALGVVAVLVLTLLALNRFGVRRAWPYLVLGVALWLAVLASGVHATIAGVALGLCIPARGRRDPDDVAPLLVGLQQVVDRPEPPGPGSRELLERHLKDVTPLLDRLLHGLHPWVAFGVIPVFALANAGVDLRGATTAILAEPVSLGVALGLFLGKQAGIFAATFLAVKTRLCPMPTGATWAQTHGVAALGGVGFTMSLFIGALAFSGQPLLATESKLGILMGSVASALLGLALLFRAAPPAAIPSARSAP